MIVFFDFCVGESGASGAPYGLDTIYQIWGDASYQTPRKTVTPGKMYIVLTTEGEGAIRYDGRSFRVRQGQTLLMQPHQDFSYGCPGDAWHFWWFELRTPSTLLPCDEVLDLVPDSFTQRLFRRCLLYARQGRWDIAQQLLLSALMILRDQLERRATPASSQLRRADRYIREHLQSVNVADLCAELGMRERTLRNAFHRELGCAPKQRITQIRLETAQQLLVNTTMSLQAIAEHTGFCSAFHLSRNFKEHYRLSPSDYRRQGGV